MVKKLTIFYVLELENGQLINAANALRTKVNRTLRKKKKSNKQTNNSIKCLRGPLQKVLLNVKLTYI